MKLHEEGSSKLWLVLFSSESITREDMMRSKILPDSVTKELSQEEW